MRSRLGTVLAELDGTHAAKATVSDSSMSAIGRSGRRTGGGVALERSPELGMPLKRVATRFCFALPFGDDYDSAS